MEDDQDCSGPPSLFKDEDAEPVEGPTVPAVDLESFRKEWEQELNKNQKKSSSSSEDESSSHGQTSTGRSGENNVEPKRIIGSEIEEEARVLFARAVSLERHGDFYEACRYYKRAFQLVPDIEKRVSSTETHSHRQDADKENISPDDDEENEDVVCSDLRSKFLACIEENGWIWLSKNVDLLDNKLHLGDFPEELLTYIVRWVISRELDYVALDNLSSVSKGFYVICRDESLWRDICLRIWGSELRLPPGFSYREMFYSQNHPWFHGCYISKITYVRSGENSFQDQSYRPWHLVEYYRYIRFLPNSTVLFLTTSEPPPNAVQALRDPNWKNPTSKVLLGSYVLTGQTITVQCTTVKKPKIVMNYNMEFTIGHAKNNRYNWVLKWNSYTVSFNASDCSAFDMEPNKFPNMIFSRVKSFMGKSEHML